MDRGAWGLQSVGSQRVGHDGETEQILWKICHVWLFTVKLDFHILQVGVVHSLPVIYGILLYECSTLLGFPDSSVGKESACNAGDSSSIPGLGRSAGQGIGYPLQYSWASLVAQLVKNSPQYGRPGLNPWVGNILWRRERLPSPVFWPREFHGLYSPRGHKEPDTTE